MEDNFHNNFNNIFLFESFLNVYLLVIVQKVFKVEIYRIHVILINKQPVSTENTHNDQLQIF